MLHEDEHADTTEYTFMVKWEGHDIELSFSAFERLRSLKLRLAELTEIPPEAQKLLGLPLAPDTVRIAGKRLARSLSRLLADTNARGVAEATGRHESQARHQAAPRWHARELACASERGEAQGMHARSLALALVQNAHAHTLCTARPRRKPSACTTSSLRALYYVRSGSSSNYNSSSSTTTLTSLAPRRP